MAKGPRTTAKTRAAAAARQRQAEEFLEGRDPTRSVYYDAVFNPYGAPPPGMPYKERSPTPVDLEYPPIKRARPPATESGASSDDDEIALPGGAPPPRQSTADPKDGSDDDIVMPTGPPPPGARRAPAVRTPIPNAASAARRGAPVPPHPHTAQLPTPVHPLPAMPPPRPPMQAPRPASAVITAEPELRDFKKEATSFIPTSIKRKERGRR
ncbi:hypothetical protein MSPP1_003449 [Malassezia sp. CBS 17886]|nr:hypothetical protein MSPP1_003449 [Malassezia sp. CBS 17886]